MFSGLVETKAKVLDRIEEGEGIRLILSRPSQFDDVAIGDSIATNGCCLTVIELADNFMAFQAGSETLSKTTLGTLQSGSFVNCERSLKLGDRIGGHLVTGHVDGHGIVDRREDSADWSDFHFKASTSLLVQMASKGSITVDGVSLTIVDVTDRIFSVALIPHTLQCTTLGDLAVGDQVNLETDLLAKYVQQQLNHSATRPQP